jgi:radical SAM superfamily enzyme
MEGTRLADEYRKKLYAPPTLDEYVSCAAECIGYVPEETVIHRLTGDCPRDMLVAPDWNADKNSVIDAIVKEMERRGISQGSLLNARNT